MLTSVTTFLGFTPLILEQAIQAQYLRPFARPRFRHHDHNGYSDGAHPGAVLDSPGLRRHS